MYHICNEILRDKVYGESFLLGVTLSLEVMTNTYEFSASVFFKKIACKGLFPVLGRRG